MADRAGVNLHPQQAKIGLDWRPRPVGLKAERITIFYFVTAFISR
jgi:hypothetical protein